MLDRAALCKNILTDNLEHLCSNEFSYGMYFIERLKYITSIQLRHDINDWIISLYT